MKVCIQLTFSTHPFLAKFFSFFNEGNVGDEDVAETGIPRNTQSHHGQSALSLFPSSLCSAIVQIINLLDDPAVSDDGNAVYEVAYQVRIK